MGEALREDRNEGKANSTSPVPLTQCLTTSNQGKRKPYAHIPGLYPQLSGLLRVAVSPKPSSEWNPEPNLTYSFPLV